MSYTVVLEEPSSARRDAYKPGERLFVTSMTPKAQRREVQWRAVSLRGSRGEDPESARTDERRALESLDRTPWYSCGGLSEGTFKVIFPGCRPINERRRRSLRPKPEPEPEREPNREGTRLD
eukprot:scaffold91_cov254-Pinguiococcus_pyrenoidosus.AAC.2